MNLLLICQTPIVEHIFSLICKKNGIDLKIQEHTNIDDNLYDLIVIDQSFIDDKFNSYKQYSKRLGAISSEELSFDKAKDFVIRRPFLPSDLQTILKDQINLINIAKQEEIISIEKEAIIKKQNQDSYDEDDTVTVDAKEYLETLADNVYVQIDDDSDESLVNIHNLNYGGVLDSSELDKINTILKEDNIQNDLHLKKNDWKNISDIIDDALDEVKEYEFDLNNNTNEPYKLVLSNYEIDEVKPLLSKFNQTVIDRLADGQTVDIRIVLRNEK